MKNVILLFVLFGIFGLLLTTSPIYALSFKIPPIPTIKPFLSNKPPKPTKIPIPTRLPFPCIHGFSCIPFSSPTPTITPTPSSTPTPTITPTPTTSPTSTPTPTPAVIVFMQDQPVPFVSRVHLPEGYKSITLTVSMNGFLADWGMSVSFNGGTSYQEQIRFPGCTNSVCNVVTIPLISNFLEIGQGTSSGNVTMIGVLNQEPLANVFTLGQGVSYPFTSSPFDSTGYNTIAITVAPGDNGQHLTGISLQRFEGGVFVEKQHLNCDGGAQCPLQTLPVLGGSYRVAVEGTGTNGIIAAILRP